MTWCILIILLAKRIVAVKAINTPMIFNTLRDLFDKKLITRGAVTAIINAGEVGLQKKQVAKVNINATSFLLLF